MISLILQILRLLLRAVLEVVMAVLIVIAFSPALVGMAIIGFQFFVWLVTETWSSIPLGDALEVIDLSSRFLDNLQGWSGLGEIVRFWLDVIPLSSCLIATGLLLGGLVAYLRWTLLDIFGRS